VPLIRSRFHAGQKLESRNNAVYFGISIDTNQFHRRSRTRGLQMELRRAGGDNPNGVPDEVCRKRSAKEAVEQRWRKSKRRRGNIGKFQPFSFALGLAGLRDAVFGGTAAPRDAAHCATCFETGFRKVERTTSVAGTDRAGVGDRRRTVNSEMDDLVPAAFYWPGPSATAVWPGRTKHSAKLRTFSVTSFYCRFCGGMLETQPTRSPHTCR